MRLDALRPGQRFRCPYTGLTGTVQRVSAGGVLCKLERGTERPEIGVLSGGTEVHINQREG